MLERGKKNGTGKRLMAVLLALVMCLTLMPSSVWITEAAEVEQESVTSDDDATAISEESVAEETSSEEETTEEETESKDTGTILYGDVNNDGVIDSSDVTELRSAIQNKLTEGYEQGDVNGDGTLSTKDISLINEYIDGTITYFPVGDVYAEGVTWVTRGEWIYQLVTIYEMSIEDESSMTEYFTDLDDCEYAEEIELAANLGIFAVEDDEFSPDEYVTREFAAHTMNNCAGYMEDFDVYLSDSDEIYYVYDAQVSVAQGWLELVNKAFRKDLYVTSDEGAGMYSDAAVLAEKTEIDEDYDNVIEYQDDVIIVDEDIEVSISGDVVTIESDEVIIIEGDKFCVTIDGVQQSYTAQSVTYDKNGYSVITVEESALEDVIETLDIQGYGEVDYDNVESLYDGVEVSVGSEQTASVGTDDTPSVSSVSVSNDTINISGSIDLGDGVKATLSGSISNITPSYDIKYSDLSLETFYFNIDADASVSATLSGTWTSTKSKEINIAKVPIISAGVFSANLKVVFTISASGEISINYVWDVSGGVQYSNGSWRVIKSFQKKSASIEAQCSESIAVKLLADVELGSSTLGEIYLMGGEKGTLSAKTQDDGVICTTLKAYLFAEVGASLNILSVKFSQSYQFINSTNSPLKLTRHWEDGELVDACTYEDTDDDDSDDEGTSDTSRSSYSQHGLAFEGVITNSTSADSRSDMSTTVIDDDLTLSSDKVVTGDLWVTGGELNLNAHTLTVYGDLHHTGGTITIYNGEMDVEGDYLAEKIEEDNIGTVTYSSVNASLQMDSTNDSMTVAGDFEWYGIYSPTLTAGELTVSGDFTDRMTANASKSSGTFKVVLNGETGQSVSMARSDSSWFNELEIGNPEDRDITWKGYLNITELLTNIIIVPEDLSVSGLDVNGNTVTFKGSITETGTVDVNAGVLSVTETLYQTGGTLNLDNGTVNIGGNYLVETTSTDNVGTVTYSSVNASLQMDSTNDSMTVAGDFEWYGIYSPTLTAGVLTVSGDFTDRMTANASKSSGVFKAVLNGENGQSVSIARSDSSWFNELEIENPEDRDITWKGYLNITELLTNITIVPEDLSVSGLDVNGNTVTFKGSITETGTVDVNVGVLNVTGTLYQTGGTLNLDNGTVNIGGNYLAETSSTDNVGTVTYSSVNASLQMDSTNDSMTVAGDFEWYGIYSPTLTAGVLTVSGDFTDRMTANASKSSGTFKAVLNGENGQSVSMARSDSSWFNELEIENPEDRDITWKGYLNITELLTNITIVPEDLSVSGLDVNGNTVTFKGSITETGTVDVNVGVLNVTGTLYQTGGTLNLDNGTVNIGGNYLAETSSTDNVGTVTYSSVNAKIQMDSVNDSMTVVGDFEWYGIYSPTLTAGVLTVGGDFVDRMTANAAKTSGSHKIILNGNEGQTVSIARSDSSWFNELEVENPETRDITWSGYLNIAGLLTDINIIPDDLSVYSLDVNGKTVTFKGSITETGTINVNAGELNVTGTLQHTGGSLKVNNGTVNIGGDYLAQTSSTDNVGAVTYSSVSANLYMTSENDEMGVVGNFEWYGSTCSLTAGVLTISGDFTDRRTSSVIKASGSHRTILNGESEQTVTFASTSGTFNTLELTRLKRTYTFSHEPCWNTLIVDVHEYEEEPVITWDEDMETATAELTCTDCGETQTYEAEVTKEVTGAACTSTGSIIYTATVTINDVEYTDVQEVTVEAIGHTVVVDEAVEPTCIESGLTEGSHCSVCGEIIVAQEEIPATGEHTWDEGTVTSEPTCTESGSITYTCTVCGETTTEELDPIDHTYISEVMKEATCEEEGLITYTCSVCGDTYSEAIPLADHTWDEGVITTEATCTEDGIRTYTCSVCGETYTEAIEAGHTWDEGVITTEATCTEDGIRTYTCSVCGETYTETIEATGHTWDDGVVTTEATYTTEGVLTYTCGLCGETKNEAIPVLTAVNLSDCTITLSVSEYTYDGTAKKPAVTVNYGSNTLTEDTDYTVSYSDITDVGTATVTVTGINGYSGQVTKNFAISKAAQNLTASISVANVNVGESVTITASAEGTITYSSSNEQIASVNASSGVVTGVAAGSATITVTAAATSNYNAATKTLTVTVIANSSNDTNTGSGTETESGTNTGTSTDTQNSANTGTSTDTNSNADSGSETNSSTEAGDTILDSSGGGTYEVTNGDSGLEVVYIKPVSTLITSIVIPDVIVSNGVTYQVTAIADGAFKDCTAIRNVTIGNYVKTIGTQAFYGCTSLTTLTIPASVVAIGTSAFEKCTSLITVSGCTSVQTVESRAFYGDTNLAIVNGMTKAETIGSKAFYKCNKLTQIGSKKSKVTLVKVKTIGSSAFYGCTAITYVNLTSTALTKISAQAFQGCTKMKTFICKSKKLITIGKKAFYDDKKLANVTFKTTKLKSSKVGANAFKGIKSTCTFKVPSSKVSAYKKIFKAKGASSKIKVKKG